MSYPDRQRVLRAMSPTAWEASNRVLYDLCREHPAHRESGEILAKVLLIGRVYAAAIERRRNKEDDHENDRFYIDTVAPPIRASACPSSNKWDKCFVRLSECFAHHFHLTRRAVDSANGVSRWSFV